MYDKRLRRSVNKAILSVRHPQYAEALKALGYQIIPTDIISCDMPYERDHADLQCLILDDTAFVLSECKSLISALSDSYHVVYCGKQFSGRYPNNVCLNALQLKNKLICRIRSLDEKVKEYCQKHGYGLINVKQGYAKCSCAVVSDHAIITADNGIIRSLEDNPIDVLPIGKGSIRLDGADTGFIGGASGYDKDRKTLYFCGNIKEHPDYNSIKRFCNEQDTQIVSLNDDHLTDIGGIIFC